MFDDGDGLFARPSLSDDGAMPVCWSYGLGLYPVRDCCRVCLGISRRAPDYITNAPDRSGSRRVVREVMASWSTVTGTGLEAGAARAAGGLAVPVSGGCCASCGRTRRDRCC